MLAEKTYLLVENGKETGPFTESQLQERIEAKEIFSETVCIPKSWLGIPGPLSSFLPGTGPEPKISAPHVEIQNNFVGNQTTSNKGMKMFCRNCSKEIDEKAVVCIGCGVPPRAEKKFCHNCGTATKENQTICISCGVALAPTPSEKSKAIATLLGMFLGGLGAQKFYMGSWGWGIIYLVLCLTFFLAWIPWIVAVVENVRIVLMTDEEFAVKAAAFEGEGPLGFFW